MSGNDTHADTIRAKADYIDRTIATVRQHKRDCSWWSDAANNFADEIEALRAEVERQRARADRATQERDEAREHFRTASKVIDETLPAVAEKLKEAQARADQAEQVLEALFTVLPEINGRFFDDAHTAWADGREHDWDEAKFRAAMSEAIGSHPIVDVAALRARADQAEAALRGVMNALVTDEDGNLVTPMNGWAPAWVAAQATLSAGSGGRLGEDGEVTAPLRSRVAPETVERSSGPSSPSRAGGRATTP